MSNCLGVFFMKGALTMANQKIATLKKQMHQDNWAAPLNEDEQKQLYEYSQIHGYSKTITWLKENFSNKIKKYPSTTSYYFWRRRYASIKQQEQMLCDMLYAQQILGDVAGVNPDYEALAKAYATYSSLSAVSGDHKKAMTFSQLSSQYHKMHMEVERAKLAQEAQALAEKKFNETIREREEATKALTNSDLTDEERAEKLRQIFAIGNQSNE